MKCDRGNLMRKSSIQNWIEKKNAWPQISRFNGDDAYAQQLLI